MPFMSGLLRSNSVLRLQYKYHRHSRTILPLPPNFVLSNLPSNQLRIFRVRNMSTVSEKPIIIVAGVGNGSGEPSVAGNVIAEFGKLKQYTHRYRCWDSVSCSFHDYHRPPVQMSNTGGSLRMPDFVWLSLQEMKST